MYPFFEKRIKYDEYGENIRHEDYLTIEDIEERRKQEEKEKKKL
jgi:hypothetical protein